MNFQMTEAQARTRDKARVFALREIAPFVAEMERSDQFPSALVRKMGEEGWLGLPIPKAYGGGGADFVSYILAIQEFSKVSAATGVILAVHTSVGTQPIVAFGSERQKWTRVPKLARGEWIGAFALTEPQAGSEAANLRTTAVRDGDHYVLNGSKIFITNAGAAQTHIVFAVTHKEQGRRGITAFIVDADTPGFKVGKLEKKMGLYGSNTAELIFENARVPVENRLGAEGEGLRIALANLDIGRIGIAAQALGIAEAAIEYSWRKLKALPSIEPSIASRMADLSTQIEAAKWLAYRAAALRDGGSPCAKSSAMAKRFATDTAMRTTAEAIDMFASEALRDGLLERLFRDAKVTQIYEGTNEIQRLVIARNLIGEGGGKA